MPIQSRWTTPIPDQTLPTFLFGSPDAKLSDSPLFIDARASEKDYFSLAKFRLWCQRFAVGLIRHGLRPGDRVMLVSANTIHYPVVVIGTVMAGGIFTGANPLSTEHELGHQIIDSGASFILAGAQSISAIMKALRKSNKPINKVFMFGDSLVDIGQASFTAWTALLAPESEAAVIGYQWPLSTSEESVHSTITLNYSSGTTGLPKGVEITHRNCIANAIQMDFQDQLDPEYSRKLEQRRLLCFLPLYHAYGLAVFIINAIKHNTPVYIMPKFDFVSMLENLQRFRISSLYLVPPVLIAMAKSPLTRKYDLEALETVACGAAPLKREMCVEFESLWPGKGMNVKQGWGMTEVTCSAMGWNPTERSEDSSVGELNANCDAMLVDPDLEYDASSAEPPRETAVGERGELWVRGPNVMKGYWRRPEATAEALVRLPDPAGTWLRTGDIAYMDENKRFFIVDRKKELIKVKGNQLAPAELEAILLEHPSIADAAVIGIPLNNDESPRAYVVTKEESSLTESEVQAYIAARVSKHKRLTGGVRFVEAIPKNPSGKILRRLLRDQAEAEMQRPKWRL